MYPFPHVYVTVPTEYLRFPPYTMAPFRGVVTVGHVWGEQVAAEPDHDALLLPAEPAVLHVR